MSLYLFYFNRCEWLGIGFNDAVCAIQHPFRHIVCTFQLDFEAQCKYRKG